MLQRYRISGKDRESGEAIEITVQADGIEGATAKAAQRNISAESIVLEQTSSPPPPPLISPLPKEQKANDNARIDPEKASQKNRHRWWLLIVGFVILITAPAYPIISLLFGLSILFLCFAVFIPQVKGISYRLIKIDPAKPWRKRFRLTIYGMIGFFFMLFAWSSFEMKAEEQRAAARQAAAAAESQRLAQEANAKVAALVKESESYAESGDLQNAVQKVDTALSVPHATDIHKARKLQSLLGYANDPERVKSALVNLSEDEFGKIENSKTVPDSLISGYTGLDQAILAVANNVRDQASAARKELKRERIEKERVAKEAAAKAEAERKAREVAAAEARQKAERERQAAEEARRKEAEKEVQNRLDSYMKVLNAADVRLIKSVSVGRISDDMWEATLTVDNLWHIRHYQIRLQDAQTLWEVWARIASPNDPDKARIKLVDQNGNEVGGSRFLAGSLIWVKED